MKVYSHNCPSKYGALFLSILQFTVFPLELPRILTVTSNAYQYVVVLCHRTVPWHALRQLKMTSKFFNQEADAGCAGS
jgi:hypothetical protein